MQKIRDISEDEMIAVYLQAEFHSSRFRQDIAAHLQKEGIDPHLLQAPDWQNGQENALRRTLLGAYRGYGRNAGYFIGFPTDVRWERATLTRQDLEQVRYIEYDYWLFRTAHRLGLLLIFLPPNGFASTWEVDGKKRCVNLD